MKELSHSYLTSPVLKDEETENDKLLQLKYADLTTCQEILEDGMQNSPREDKEE